MIVIPEFAGIPESQLRWTRKEYVRRYAWAIPNEAAIETMTLSPLIDIGADSGYWASHRSRLEQDPKMQRRQSAFPQIVCLGLE